MVLSPESTRPAPCRPREEPAGAGYGAGPSHSPRLPAPTGLSAEAGVNQVTLWWDPVDGAAGYVISRAKSPGGRLAPLDHGGSDVLAVPGPPYADTAVGAGLAYSYTVASVPGPDEKANMSPSSPVVVRPLSGHPEIVHVDVDASRSTGTLQRVWAMVGSERLSQLDMGQDAFGHDVGTEFRDALAIAHDQLGARWVRAHGIFHDDFEVFSWPRSGPRFNFAAVDRALDTLLGLDLKPVVELSFMPRELARDPDATVFEYRAHISPPRDWEIWAELNAKLAEHVLDRYGVGEVAEWGFEVWNEPNLGVFWTGTQAEYFKLYEAAARAIKEVEPRLRVGGPATAAAGWIEDFAAFAQRTKAPVDFVSTHTYGNVPLDLRAVLTRHGLGHAQIWWTEWGVGFRHSAPVHGSAFDAPFLLRGYKAAQGRVDALSHWVVSDHFEELGRPQRLFHNGFGLLTVGNLRKPRFWAQHMAQELGDELLSVELRGDGAGSLVDAWAARAADGRIDVLIWNGTPDAAEYEGNPALRRKVMLRMSGLGHGGYSASLARVDQENSNIAPSFGHDKDWPDAEGWEKLRERDQLTEQRFNGASVRDGGTEFEIELPMPGVARLRLEPRQMKKGGVS